MKRFIPIVLILALMTSMLVLMPIQAAAAPKNYYMIVNDELIPAPGGVSATITDEMVYVPLDVFTQYFGFSYSYDYFSNALTVTSGKKSIYFNRKLGLAVDDNKNYYSYTFYFTGNVFMVPCQFLCNFFGLRYSYIPNGPLVRISNNSAALTDGEVYAKYENIFVTQTPVAPEQDYNKSVYLTFNNTPNENTKAILDALSRYSATATFFLTTEGIREYPELVFRMIAEGHTIGINGSEKSPAALSSGAAYLADIDNCNEVLYQTAKIKTRLVRCTLGSKPALTASIRDSLTQAGYRIWDYNVSAAYPSSRNVSPATIYANLTASLTNRKTHAVVLFNPDSATTQSISQILSYLTRNQFSFLTISDLQTPLNQWNDKR
jgi:peptidoglycan/xylan/chitin deacetylase (PgdA/CDA1 family)